MSKFYPHVISTEASYHIYTSQWPVINVKANFCAYNVWLLQQTETEASLVYIIAVLLVKIIINGIRNGGLLPFLIFRDLRL